MKSRILAAVLLGTLFWASLPVIADDPNIAPCPPSTGATNNMPPTRLMYLRIFSVRPTSNLDPSIPFSDPGRADIYGHVKIGGIEFRLPKKPDTNSPVWDDIDGKFNWQIPAGVKSVPISIRILDSDTGSDDDVIDVSPVPNKAILDFDFDPCALWVGGDFPTKSNQEIIEVAGDQSDDAAKITFIVGMEDGKPISSDDLALMSVDLIQVIPKTPLLVAYKPTVVAVTVANTFSIPMRTTLQLTVGGPGDARRDLIELNLGANQVQTNYYYTNNPLRFTNAQPNVVTVSARIDLANTVSSTYPPGDCRRGNDSTPPTKLRWKVVRMRSLDLTWTKVNTTFDGLNYAPDSEFQEIMNLGNAFIKATYPISSMFSSTSPIPITLPHTSALDWFFTIISAITPIPIPIDALIPYIFVYELGNYWALSGEQVIGVLPRWDWFKRFSEWPNVGGLSLGDTFPRAVIVVPTFDLGGGLGPVMGLPAHELGHTFGLSVDPALKDYWACSFFSGPGSALCGAIGGLDEYNSKDEIRKKGNPASGFWVAQGGEPFSLASIINQPQCDSHCFMGLPRSNAQNNWSVRKSWIDRGDYNQLFERLRVNPDPEVIYLSGMISYDDKVYLGPWHHVTEGTPDVIDRQPQVYAFRFLNGHGALLQEVGLPLNWEGREGKLKIPVTFFGLYVPYPKTTRRIQIWNRYNNKLLIERQVSANIPAVRIIAPTQKVTILQGKPLEVRWQGSDTDHDQLAYFIQVSSDGEHWWPVAMQLTEQTYQIPTDVLKPGRYFWRVMASDGIHIGKSPNLSFVVQSRAPSNPIQ
ncbi:MAG TPA: hypothetical protein VJ464_11015 [Blastocatellia bacterium]|nr:hypothetical protein [Blastocatellia bacterium]